MAMLTVPVFSFKDPSGQCPNWSTGKHIVLNGQCKCGRKFVIVEEEANG